MGGIAERAFDIAVADMGAGRDVVGEMGVDLVGAGRRGLGQVGDRGQGVVIDHDHLRRVLGDGAAVGDDDRDGLAGEGDAFAD